MFSQSENIRMFPVGCVVIYSELDLPLAYERGLNGVSAVNARQKRPQLARLSSLCMCAKQSTHSITACPRVWVTVCRAHTRFRHVSIEGQTKRI